MTNENLQSLKEATQNKNERTGVSYGIADKTGTLWNLEREQLVNLIVELDIALQIATSEYDGKRYNKLISDVVDNVIESDI